MKKIAILLTIIFILPVNGFYNKFNEWSGNFEGRHECIREWWNVDAFIEADKNYSITMSFEYEKETPASNMFFTLFDWSEKSVYNLSSYNDELSALKCSEKNFLNLTYKNSWMRGKYPFYILHLESKGIILDMKITAEAEPKFVVEEQGGVLPIGFGYYKYVFIPKCKARGTLFIDGSLKKFEGTAYYEHVWGNWSYHNPLKGNAIKYYFKLAGWWWKNKNISSGSLTISSDNPFGYDWAWIAFDNGWSMFYGVIPFWIREIPLGVIYLYNGKDIVEFGKINYKYVNGTFYKGAYIPNKICFTAEGEGKLKLVMEMKNTPHIYEDELKSFYWKKLILYECPGFINGWYENRDEKINLSGKCEIEIEREVSIFEYNMLRINPYSDGFELIFLSYIMNFVITLQLFFNPFSINLSFSNIR
ncbi:MAG TPA: hypothetical protein ENI33_04430 [Thermoplasmatales archaeon]|nr:hypothetical protein [Thermoplasmatales archaeon]